MNIYELICETNKKIMQGENFTDAEKQKISNELLSNVSSKDTVSRFHKGVNATGGMYPAFYITPYNNGKKLRLITGELPKTHILAANGYELEILRILALFAGDNIIVKSMLGETADRLDTTCFSNFCPQGECAGAGIAALRFWSAYNINDTARQGKIIRGISKYRDGKGKYKLDLPMRYTRLAFSGCDYETVKDELEYLSENHSNRITHIRETV